jgi:hypothetical protein
VADLLSTSGSRGSTESAALGGGHGAACRSLGGNTGKKEGAREKKKGGGASHGVARGSPGDPSRRQEAGGGEQEVASGSPGSSTQVLLCPNEEDKVSLHLAPWLWGIFWRNKIEQVLYVLVHCICVKTSENSRGFSAK